MGRSKKRVLNRWFPLINKTQSSKCRMCFLIKFFRVSEAKRKDVSVRRRDSYASGRRRRRRKKKSAHHSPPFRYLASASLGRHWDFSVVVRGRRPCVTTAVVTHSGAFSCLSDYGTSTKDMPRLHPIFGFCVQPKKQGPALLRRWRRWCCCIRPSHKRHRRSNAGQGRRG